MYENNVIIFLLYMYMGLAILCTLYLLNALFVDKNNTWPCDNNLEGLIIKEPKFCDMTLGVFIDANQHNKPNHPNQ